MKTSKVLAVVTLLAAMLLAVDKRVELSFRTMKVWLGMPRAEVLRAAADAGYVAREGSNSEIRINASDGDGVDILLKQGQVVFAGTIRGYASTRPLAPVIESLLALQSQKCSIKNESQAPDNGQ